MRTSKQPWKVLDHGGPVIRWEVRADNNIPIFVTFGQTSQLEDAQLGAAAPDLLAALIALHDSIAGYFSELEHLEIGVGEPLIKARAAIAKATGAA